MELRERDASRDADSERIMEYSLRKQNLEIDTIAKDGVFFLLDVTFERSKNETVVDTR